MATTSTLSGILPKYNKFVHNITLSQLIKCAFIDTRTCQCMVYCMTFSVLYASQRVLTQVILF